MEYFYIHHITDNRVDRYGAWENVSDHIDDISHLIDSNPRSVLTTDDGFRSNLKLESFYKDNERKAYIFITTGFVDGVTYPYELEVSSFIEGNERVMIFGREYQIKTKQEKNNAFSIIHNKMKDLSKQGREKVVKKFRAENSCDQEMREKNLFLSWEDIKRLSSNKNIIIGSHTVNHLHLPSQSIFVIFRELYASKKIIEGHLGKKIYSVSYPYGAASFVIRLLAWIVGYREGFVTHKRRRKFMAQNRKVLVKKSQANAS